MEVVLNGQKINVIIIHKKIKNIYFRFSDAKTLCISASKYISDKEILKLIEKNRDSLEKMLAKITQKINKANEFWYLGNHYDLVYDSSLKEIEFQNGTLYAKDAEMVDKFLKIKTREIFKDEVEKIKQIIKTPPFTLKFRKMKTRWGVCNYKLCTITLNTELIRYSKDNLRYVIIHEMCHFYHHNHSKEFWNTVEKYCPDYKKARKELRD